LAFFTHEDVTPLQMSAMLRLSLAFKQSKESMYSVINSLTAKDGCMRSRLDRRLGGGSAAMLAKLSSAQISRNDKLLHSVLLQPCTLPLDSKRLNPTPRCRLPPPTASPPSTRLCATR
jgi:hypothetical protein